MRARTSFFMKHPASGAAISTVLAGLTLLLAGFGSARAGGLFLYEVGTPDMYTAGAGWAARAQDAATVLTNPAGMTRVKNGDFLVGGGATYGDIQFVPNENTIVDGGGGDGGVAVGWMPNGGAYYAHKVSDSWWFGMAATSNFGLMASYEEDWVGRYYVQSSTLMGLSLLPSVAWRVSPQFSLGASFNAMYGILTNDVAVNNGLSNPADGKLSISANDLSYGGNVGALWEPSERSRIGVTYTSRVKLDFVDQPEFTGVDPGFEAALKAAGLWGTDLGIEIVVPQTVMTSFYSDLSPDWALMGDFGWQDWSAFGGVNVEVATDPPTALSTQLPYKDTWRGALGAKRRLGGGWLLSGGVGYDSTPVEDADRSVSQPLSAAWRYALGAERQFSDKFNLGLGYTYMSLGDMPVDVARGPLAGRVAGSFESSVIHVISLQGHWKF